jgi:hypothetical protein
MKKLVVSLTRYTPSPDSLEKGLKVNLQEFEK